MAGLKIATIVAHFKKQTPYGGEGGVTKYHFFASDERYIVDFAPDFKEGGWVQYDTDQDAWYFGVWVSPPQKLILSYAEGDWNLTECPTEEIYHEELKRMAEFYGPPPPAFTTCTGVQAVDGKIAPAGEVTHYYDQRPV